MATLNHAQVIGNAGADPEIRYIGPVAGDGKTATFSLATKERYKGRDGRLQEYAEWHSIVAFGRLADLAEKYIRKGALLFVEGRLRTRQWTDQSGQRHNRTDIIADNIQLIGGRQEQSGDPYVAGARQMSRDRSGDRPAQTQAATAFTAPAPVQGDMFTDGPDDDDLPF